MAFQPKRSSNPSLFRWLSWLLCAALLTLAGCSPAETPDPPPPPLDPNGKTGVSMRGYNFTAEGVESFSVNGARVSNLPDYGGGGADTCCAMLPNRWHEGMTVRVDWTTSIWTTPYEPREHMSIDDQLKCCVRRRTLSREVSVQRYERPATLQVFFLPDDEVEVWVTDFDLGHPQHPSGREYPTKPKAGAVNSNQQR